MKQLLLIVCVLMTLSTTAQRVIKVKKDDAKSLLAAIEEANRLNANPDASRIYVLIPNGFYDLGKTVLTRITGHHIAFIGESMEGTVIQNKPDIETEGISKTGIFQNRGSDNYFQDMTLRNALDYYACGAAGRAVTLHDKGTRTICNRVRMLSYQDTYYSDAEDCQHYFQDSEIHGTVDFICGAGDVWFERCTIVTEKRSKDGTGRNVIAAPRTSQTPWGYIFNQCTIKNIISDFVYARGWHTTPRCVWLNTKILDPDRLVPTRFDTKGMRTIKSYFKEYQTTDGIGRNITPISNIITLTLKDEKNTVETVLTPEEAVVYKLDNVFKDWNPVEVIQQIEKKAQKLMKRL